MNKSKNRTTDHEMCHKSKLYMYMTICKLYLLTSFSYLTSPSTTLEFYWQSCLKFCDRLGDDLLSTSSRFCYKPIETGPNDTLPPLYWSSKQLCISMTRFQIDASWAQTAMKKGFRNAIGFCNAETDVLSYFLS